MKYCTKCGKELLDEAVFCPYCGCQVGYVNNTPPVADGPDTAIAVLSFFFPLVGFILYVVMKDATPLRAKSAGKGALIGLIVGAVCVILPIIIIFSLFGNILGIFGIASKFI